MRYSVASFIKVLNIILQDLPHLARNGENATPLPLAALSARPGAWFSVSLTGALCIIAAEFMFAAMGATIRHLGPVVGNEQLVFLRNAVGLALLLPLLLGGSLQLRTQVAHLHLVRALAGLAAMYCFYYALAHMPLAEAMLLKLSAPLFIPLVALWWLGEGLTLMVTLAVLAGFVGVAVTLAPSFGAIAPVASVALLGGAFAALAKVAVRRLGRTEPPRRTVFYFALIATGVASLPALWGWIWPASKWWSWILLLGLLATLGQLLLTRGFAIAPAGELAPFTYFSLVFAALIGWLFWDEPVAGSTVVGSLLVLASGVLTARFGLRAASMPAPTPP